MVAIGQIFHDDQHVIVTHPETGMAAVSSIEWLPDGTIRLHNAFQVKMRASAPADLGAFTKSRSSA
jgi:hypothetical protein